MNVLSYKEKRPLRIAAALILALAMMVTAMPMTVIAQTVTTASQAAETNEAPAQAIEAEKAPLAENAAFEEKAEAEENSYEAAAPEAQQETSEEIKTETTVAETSSETRKAQEKALPEKSGNDYESYSWNDDERIMGDDPYTGVRYFILQDTDSDDPSYGELKEITRPSSLTENGTIQYGDASYDLGNGNTVNPWSENHYNNYHGNRVKLSSNQPVDVAYRFLGDYEQKRGTAIQLNFVGMDGSETNYRRYSVCYAIGTSTGTDLNFFDNTEVYEKTKFFQLGRAYYGPTEGGPYIKSVDGDGTAVAQNSGKQVSKVLWSFNEAAEDYREYDDSPAVFVIFKRAKDMEYGQDNNLVISHKALSEADGAIYPETNVLNGNGARTITKCQVIRREEHEDDIITNVPFVAVEGTNDIRITENSLSSVVGNYTNETTQSLRIELASEDDNIEDVFVQTAKANVTNPNVYRAVTSTNSSPKDINSVVWKKVEVEESGVTKTYYEADAFLVLSLLDSANDDNLNDSGKTVVETLYSNATTENFTVTLKYYDKDRSTENSNKPADVSYTPTVVPVKTTLPTTYSSDAMSTVIANAYKNSNISNVLDTIAFNTTDQGYENLLTGMDMTPYHGGGYYSDKEGKEYHTDWYGRVYGDTANYMKENPLSENEVPEKWITYYDVSGEEIPKDVYTASDFDKHRISNIVVWGYNYPKTYRIWYALPNTASDLFTYQYKDQNNDSQTIYLTSAEKAISMSRIFCYNQRIGNEYIKSNSTAPDSTDPRNSVSNHLVKWGLTDINGFAMGGEASPAVTAEDTVPDNSDLVFDGWYINNGSDDKPNYVKVSSDKEYTGRVLGQMTLIAGYKQKTAQQNDDCGFTITTGNTEAYYTEEGQARTLITTVLNSYGYPDGDANLNKNKAAIIYIINNVGLTPDADNVAELIQNDQTFRAEVEAALNNPQNPNKVLLNGVNGEGQTSSSGNNFPGICYYYVVNTTDPDEGDDGTAGDTVESGIDRILKLTNKNRAQFVLDMPSEKLGNNGAYNNLIVLVAVEHDINNNETELVFSDNYINYIRVSEQSLI